MSPRVASRQLSWLPRPTRRSRSIRRLVRPISFIARSRAAPTTFRALPDLPHLGESEAILLRARATAQGLDNIAQAIDSNARGTDAVSLTIAEKYVDAFGRLAKEGTTVIVPAAAADAGSMVAQVRDIFFYIYLKGETKVQACGELDVINARGVGEGVM